MTLLQGASERPIQNKQEDALNRSGFVERLVDALISPTTKRSTGLTIGITGPWGSGKSSILNLVQAEIRERHGDRALVVAFDPWLVSGRDDLIGSFFAATQSALGSDSRRAQKLRQIASDLLDLARHVTPYADVVVSGSAPLASLATDAAKKRLERRPGLAEVKQKLTTSLSKTDVALVVLIDELDRVEDAEIRAMAQLVRAVLDFPNISFLLAYDAERVAQALGHGAPPGQEAERGRAYLEKIVQLQIPIPILTREECRHILDRDLAAVATDLALPNGWAADKRYSELAAGLIAPEGIATLRDIKRLTGTYHALARLVGREVDWIDLLAYAFLLTKAPRTVANIRERPHLFSLDMVSHDPMVIRQTVEHLRGSRENPKAALKDANAGGEVDPATDFVLEFLFASSAASSHTDDGPDRLRRRRPLSTVLRLGLTRGDYSRDEIETVLRADKENVRCALQEALGAGRLDALVGRLRALYGEVPNTGHEAFWLGLAAFLRKPRPAWLTQVQPQSGFRRDVAPLIWQGLKSAQLRADEAKSIFEVLVANDDLHLAPVWLQEHFRIHGLFGYKQEQRPAFLTANETEAAAWRMARAHRRLHRRGTLLPALWVMNPIWNMVDIDAWDDACRTKLDRALKGDEALDGFTLLVFGGDRSGDKASLQGICDYDAYIKRAKARLAKLDQAATEPSLVAALSKAVGEDF
jgi:hypothetical protein